ncbi:MAG: [FeFe] hydrogenase H-cluster maturation GTPase HydF [Parasporobacterium sp.]|nr:[FeFe] hydrogenase H-cluster maturation GTPase HydF [Parasporobacterium sp.]
MSLNDTPSGERTHIGFFGRRNAGKSSLVNAFTGQDLSVVSDVQGTTTDPVRKAMELLPLGPVVIIDTPGFDDEGMLGELRVKKTKQVLNRIDIAILVVDCEEGIKACEEELIALFKEKEVPYLTVYNKADLLGSIPAAGENEIYVSALNKTNIWELKEMTARIVKAPVETLQLVGDFVEPKENVILVIPIDKAAPKGRLILPQQMVIRDLLEANVCVSVVKETELTDAINGLKKKPGLVITDSQIFKAVDRDVPEDIDLTSFSIILARYKGLLNDAVKGALAIDKLKDGDKVLICEGCSHHRQCDDIGTYKIPKWLREYTGKELVFEATSGREYPEDLSEYALVIHCGACMLTEKEMKYRIKCANDQNVPITNYGITIAYVQGILKRAVKIFPYLYELFEDK